MPFTKGKGGRPKGARNKRTIEFLEVLEVEGFCPASTMIELYRIALARFTEEIEKEDSGRLSPMESKAASYLKIASDHVSNLASYAYPKLKSIEQNKPNPAAGLTAQQKLDAAKLMVQLLESEVKKDAREPIQSSS